MGDQIEIAISCSSLRGVVNVESIRWDPLILSETYKDNAATYNKVNYLNDADDKINTYLATDLTRICEQEDAELDWIEHKYIPPYEKKKMFDMQLLSRYFDIKKILCAGIDILTTKYYLVAREPQIINASILGIEIKIVKENDTCMVEVKKLGLLYDRHTQMQMRVGELLVFYFTKD